MTNDLRWALGRLDESRLSRSGRRGLGYARTLANAQEAATSRRGTTPQTNPAAWLVDWIDTHMLAASHGITERQVRRLIARAKKDLRARPRRCSECLRELAPQSRVSRATCSDACRKARQRRLQGGPDRRLERTLETLGLTGAPAPAVPRRTAGAQERRAGPRGP